MAISTRLQYVTYCRASLLSSSASLHWFKMRLRWTIVATFLSAALFLSILLMVLFISPSGHWQAVRQRVAFKVAGLLHQSLAGAAPAYLADDCHLLSDAGRRPLRSHSNDIRKLLVPRTHNKLGDRSFSAAGPRLWNDLPPRLRRPGLSFDSFRWSLKTHLFGNWSA